MTRVKNMIKTNEKLVYKINTLTRKSHQILNKHIKYLDTYPFTFVDLRVTHQVSTFYTHKEILIQ